MGERNIYLSTIEPAEAVRRAKAALTRAGLIKPESVPAHEALGRVTSSPIFARCSSPTYHAAAMDGIAVASASTFAAREGSPVTLRRGVDYTPVNTGNPLPDGLDAVVMIEHVEQVDDDTVRLEAPAFPWQHVRRIGEDIVATELLLPQNHTLSPYDIGALLSAGIFEVPVWERVRVTFIPTGDEVLNFLHQPTPKAGQVIESNSQVFCAIAAAWGAQTAWTAPVPDKPEALRAAVAAALADGAHVVIVGAGSSAGSKDYTRETFESFGKLLCHGISVMPGKPTLLAVTQGLFEGRLLGGAPGYPVSAVVCLEDVLEPIVRWLVRQEPPGRRTVTPRLARKTPRRPGLEEIVRLAVGKVGEGYVAAPLARGAGLITSLTKAQAITRIPTQSEGLAQDAMTPSLCFRGCARRSGPRQAKGDFRKTAGLRRMRFPAPARPTGRRQRAIREGRPLVRRRAAPAAPPRGRSRDRSRRSAPAGRAPLPSGRGRPCSRQASSGLRSCPG